MITPRRVSRTITVGQTRVVLDYASDLTGEVRIHWITRDGPAPAIGGLGDVRPVVPHELVLPVRSLGLQWDATWPGRLPDGLPPEIAAAAMAILHGEQIKARLRALLEDPHA